MVPALKWIPTGGLYVTGGLTPKNIEMIKGPDSPFMKAYLDKGRLRPLLDTGERRGTFLFERAVSSTQITSLPFLTKFQSPPVRSHDGGHWAQGCASLRREGV